MYVDLGVWTPHCRGVPECLSHEGLVCLVSCSNEGQAVVGFLGGCIGMRLPGNVVRNCRSQVPKCGAPLSGMSYRNSRGPMTIPCGTPELTGVDVNM